MPVTDIPSYLPTMDEFIVHWTALNASRRTCGLPVATLRDGSTVQQFEALRGELAWTLETLRALAEERQRIREEREYHQAELRARLVQFRDLLLERAPGTPYAEWAQSLQVFDPSRRNHLRYLDAAIRHWEAMGPVALARSYSLREFRSDVECFRELCRAGRSAA